MIHLTLTDSHCHLADEAYDPDLPDVIARARHAGVSRALCILTAGDDGEAERGRRVAALWPDARFATGVHPHVATGWEGRVDDAVAVVEREARGNSRVRAIGEIGLDYHYDFSPRALQRELFARQIALARALALPIVIHTREADEDTLDIIRSEGRGDVRGVFHCFTGGPARARRALDLGFSVSVAGIVTFPKATDIRDAIATVPADRLLIETDSPYLAPVPHRGKRNEPAWVRRVAEVVAGVRGESEESTAAHTTAAFASLFGT